VKAGNVQELIRIEIVFLVRTGVLGNSPKYVALLQDKNIIIIINIQCWAIWPVPSPELKLLSPSFLWSPNCSLSVCAVKV
jgi:hypothetical protein